MNVRIAQLFSFYAGTWYDDALEMTEYTVKLWCITDTYNDQEQNIAMRRAKHFVFNEIEHTIFIDSAESAKAQELIQAGLDVTTIPGPPADQIIGIMLFHKLNAIMEDRIRLVEIEISTGGGIVYLHSENETSDDLIQPDWWSAADLVHRDSVLIDSEKVLSIPQANAWRDFDLAWPDDPESANIGNVVVFADFKQTDETK
jgi:hypothetical protein